MIVKMKSRISLDELLHRIEYAEHEEIDSIIDALQRRYRRLFPDWDVVFLSMPTGSEEAMREQAKLTIEFIQKHYFNA